MRLSPSHGHGGLAELDKMLADLEWRIDSAADTECLFRGVLEPQLADGHAVGWKH